MKKEVLLGYAKGLNDEMCICAKCVGLTSTRQLVALEDRAKALSDARRLGIYGGYRMGRLKFFVIHLLVNATGLGILALCIMAASLPLVVTACIIVLIPSLLIDIEVSVRRAHDIGWPGAAVLLLLVPLVDVVVGCVLLLKPGDKGGNDYGPPPEANSRMWYLLLLLLVISILIAIALTQGPRSP